MRNLLKWDIEGVQPEMFSPEDLKAAEKLIDIEAKKRGPYDEDDYMERTIQLSSGRQVQWNGKIVQLDQIPRKDRGKVIKGELEVSFFLLKKNFLIPQKILTVEKEG